MVQLHPISRAKRNCSNPGSNISLSYFFLNISFDEELLFFTCYYILNLEFKILNPFNVIGST